MSRNDDKDRDKSKGDLLRDIILMLVGGLLAGVPVVTSTIYQSRSQSELAKHSLMTEFQCRTAELFDEAVYSAEILMDKYGVAKVQAGDIPSDEIEAFNAILKDLNVQLSRLYVIMPDTSYANIKEAASGVSKLKQLKCKILTEMRRSQFPETVHTTEEDIRFLNYIRKK